MPPSLTNPAVDRLRHAWIFFRHWLKDPLTTASVVPSGDDLARAMADRLHDDDQCVVELGPGTGAITGRLIERLGPEARFTAVELNERFAKTLSERYPAIEVLTGDARQLGELLPEAFKPVDAVVSSLGFLAMPESLCREILEAVFLVMNPQGRIIQFSYTPRSPIPQRVLEGLGAECKRVSTAWKNLPPAFVFEIRRKPR